MKYVDVHCHYDDIIYDDDRDELINKLYEQKVEKIITSGYDFLSSKKAIEISEKYDYIYTTVGISPNHLTENFKSDFNEIEKLLQQNKKIVGIGEIGFDYYYDIDKELQKQAFKEQIELANKYELPIVIHTREAVMDTLEMLKKNPVNKKGIFHCCPFNRELVKEALKLDFYISISGIVTFKNAKNAKEIVQLVPIDRLLTETDSPCLSPEPFRGKRNDSGNLKYIVEKIAEYKEMDLEEIAEKLYNNAMRIYNIEE